MQLPAALVYRLGGQQFDPSNISTKVDFEIDAETESIVIRFGCTDSYKRNDSVALVLQKDDLVQLLRGASSTLPRLAEVFTECAATATAEYFKLASDAAPKPAPKSDRWVMELLETICANK